MQEDANVNLLHEGDFVAIKLENYRKHPIIGNSLEVNDDDFVICYWKGSYNKEWAPHTLRRGSSGNQLWTQQLPKSCIICFGFSLDETSKLLPGTKAYLRKEYKEDNSSAPEAEWHILNWILVPIYVVESYTYQWKIITLLWAEFNANLFPNSIVTFTSVVNSGVNNSHRSLSRNSAFQIKTAPLS